MFLIVCDPSSGSTELCVTEITLSGSEIFFVCLVGVWQRYFEPAVCMHGMTGCELLFPAHRTVHMKNICEPLTVISVKHSSVLPDDGWHTIRNTLE